MNNEPIFTISLGLLSLASLHFHVSFVIGHHPTLSSPTQFCLPPRYLTFPHYLIFCPVTLHQILIPLACQLGDTLMVDKRNDREPYSVLHCSPVHLPDTHTHTHKHRCFCGSKTISNQLNSKLNIFGLVEKGGAFSLFPPKNWSWNGAALREEVAQGLSF